MNYKTCTTQELAYYFLSKTSQAITQQLMYYQGRGDSVLVVKIKKARLLSKQMKLAATMEALDD